MTSERVEFRTTAGRLATVAVAVACAAGLVATGVQDLGVALRWAPAMTLVAVLAWALLDRPAVVVHDGGVDLRNVTRTVHLPWAAIVRVDTRYALTLQTRDTTFSAWAAPAPSRAQTMSSTPADLKHLDPATTIGGAVRPGDLLSSASGQAAEVIRRRWQALADAGELTGPAEPVIRWHTGLGIAVAALVVLSAVALRFG